MQLEAIASRPITSYLGEETNTHLITISFHVFVLLSIKIFLNGFAVNSDSAFLFSVFSISAIC